VSDNPETERVHGGKLRRKCGSERFLGAAREHAR
jgi:hypothetical protein